MTVAGRCCCAFCCLYVHHYSTMYSYLFYFVDNSEVISAALGFGVGVDTGVCVC